jgi:hypothetical protein
MYLLTRHALSFIWSDVCVGAARATYRLGMFRAQHPAPALDACPSAVGHVACTPGPCGSNGQVHVLCSKLLRASDAASVAAIVVRGNGTWLRSAALDVCTESVRECEGVLAA